MTPRQSFLLSLAVHLGLLLVLVVAGAVVARRVLLRKPIEIDLMAPVRVGPEEAAAGEEPESEPELEPEPEPELEPEIVEREVPGYDPSATIDLDKIPEIEKEQFQEYKPEIKVSSGDGGAGPDGTDYGRLIGAEIKRHWKVPAVGVTGPAVPKAEVVVTVARSGRILDYRVTRSSGNKALDDSVLEAVRKANPLPAFPPELTGAQREFTLQFIPEE